MSRTPAAKSPDAEAIAADWVVRHDAGLTPAELTEFRAWLSADPEHAAAWKRHNQTWNALGRPLQAGQGSDLVQTLALRSARKRRRRAGVVAAVAGLMLGGLVWRMVPRPEVSPTAAAVAAAPGAHLIAPELRRLSDGTVVELKPGAQITEQFSGGLRQVTLVRGEARFQVVHDAARPFLVRVGGMEVRDVGTVFSVQLGIAKVQVMVTEGQVAVGTASAGLPPGSPVSPRLSVHAGNRLVLPVSAQSTDAAVVAPVSPAQIEDQLSWLQPRLEFTDTPLRDAVGLIQGHSHTQFVIADQSLNTIRISGFFRLDNSDTFVRMLEASFGVRAERAGETITLRKRE